MPRNPQNTRKKRPGSRRPGSARTASPPRFRLTKKNMLEEPADPALRRYFKLETLASAVEGLLEQERSLLRTPCKNTMGSAPLTSATLELLDENTYRFVFYLRANNIKRKRATFRLVVAKNAEEHSQALTAEFDALRLLHGRVPKCCVEPVANGRIPLPDRHRRKNLSREVFAYLTAPSGGYHPLLLRADGRLAAGAQRPKSLTNPQTEAVKRRMIEILLRSCDPNARTAIRLPEVAAGHLLLDIPRDRPPQLKVCGCPGLRSRVTPALLINDIVRASWESDGRACRLLPEDPAEFLQALTNALGKKTALEWLELYRKAIKAGSQRENKMLTAARISALIESS